MVTWTWSCLHLDICLVLHRKSTQQKPSRLLNVYRSTALLKVIPTQSLKVCFEVLQSKNGAMWRSFFFLLEKYPCLHRHLNMQSMPLVSQWFWTRKTKKKKEQYFVICLLTVRYSVATWVLPEPWFIAPVSRQTDIQHSVSRWCSHGHLVTAKKPTRQFKWGWSMSSKIISHINCISPCPLPHLHCLHRHSTCVCLPADLLIQSLWTPVTYIQFLSSQWITTVWSDRCHHRYFHRKGESNFRPHKLLAQ